jgi:putative NADPH-quinone reductase
MKISVIVAHPDEQSLNHAIAKAIVQFLNGRGHRVFFHDLYFEKFDPVLPREEIRQAPEETSLVRRHCDEIADADGIVLIHPNWWGQPPAILKGWVDRVLRQGVAYRFEEGDGGEGIPVGLLKAKAAIVLNTSNTEESRENEVFGDPLENLWKRCIFQLCGIPRVERRMYRVVVTSTAEERQSWIEDAVGIVRKYF